MSDTFVPRLRGNVFLLLLLHAAVDNMSVAPGWGSSSQGLTRSQLFSALMRTVSPSYRADLEKTLQQYLSSYLDGRRPNSQKYYPFKNTAFQQAADMYVNENYRQALSEMDSLCHTYLDLKDKEKIRLLVAELVDVILGDDTVEGEFNTGSKTVAKSALSGETKFNLPIFLLSVWHYIVVNKPNSEEGAETYENWTEYAGEGNPKRVTTDIGRERAKKITVSTELPKMEAQSDTATYSDVEEAPENIPEPDILDDGAEPEQTIEQTLDNKGRVYIQRAEKIVNIEHVEHLEV